MKLIIFCRPFRARRLFYLDPGVARETRLPLATFFRAFSAKRQTGYLRSQGMRSPMLDPLSARGQADDVADAPVAQQFVKGVEVLAQYFVKPASMRGQLGLKHRLYFALLCSWLEVAAGNSVGQVIKFTYQLWRITDRVLSLAGQLALNQIVLELG